MFPHGGPPHWVACLICPLGGAVLGKIPQRGYFVLLHIMLPDDQPFLLC